MIAAASLAILALLLIVFWPRQSPSNRTTTSRAKGWRRGQ